MILLKRLWIVLALIATCTFAQTKPRALVLISIDGMANRYLNEADTFHLKIPTLRRILAEGAHAEGVRGVMPTVTYPSHTSLITGVSPAKHGILQNVTFDPEDRNLGGWYWYSEDIRVPTLWEIAAKAGYPVGSVNWPVSVGAPGVSYLIPEYWRSTTDDDRKLLRAMATPGLIAEIEPQAGPYFTDLNTVAGDGTRTRYAEAIILRKHVRFISVHLTALDHIEHEAGPYSPEAFAALEEIDKMVAAIEKAMRQETPETAICIVSDHGFAPVSHQLNLRAAFVKAGLITVNSQKGNSRGTFSDWKAAPWGGGGSSFVVLKDSQDTATRGAVEALLRQLAGDPTNGIDHVLDRAEIAALGGGVQVGTYQIAFAVDMKPGFTIGNGLDTIALPVKPGGQHGFSPVHPEMRASFILAGPGVRKGVNVGDIDMRSIAPTLAKLLGSSMPSAEQPPLDVFF
jgi:predicted AlkP superfamily pyrophosphatase or phosphodiesterase